MRIKSFLFCFTLLAIRAWERLLNPGIWAEDGKVFIADSLRFGWSAIFTPYEGYFHLFNRIAVQLLSYLPIVQLPLFITLVCLVLYAGVMSTFAHERYRYLIPSDLNRFLIAAVMCCTPGGPEVIGNLANSHRILAIFFMLIALKPHSEKMSWTEVLLSFVIAGSAGEVLLFVPLLAYRAFQRYRSLKSLSSIAHDLLALAIVFFWSALNFSVRGTNSVPLDPNFIEIAHETYRTVLFYFVLEPVFGWRLTGNLYHYLPFLFWALSILLSGYAMVQIWKKRSSYQIAGYLALMCLFGVQFLSWLVRGVDRTQEFPPGMWLVNDRSSFTIGFTGFLLWCFLTGQKSKKFGIAFVVLYFTMTNQLAVRSYGDFSYWPESAKALESSAKVGCPAEVVVPVFPKNWGNLTYRSKVANENCSIQK